MVVALFVLRISFWLRLRLVRLASACNVACVAHRWLQTFPFNFVDLPFSSIDRWWPNSSALYTYPSLTSIYSIVDGVERIRDDTTGDYWTVINGDIGGPCGATAPCVLQVSPGARLDYDSGLRSFNVTVTARSIMGLTSTQWVIITVNPINERTLCTRPVLSSRYL